MFEHLRKRTLLTGVVALSLTAPWGAALAQGKIVVANDEWLASPTGIDTPGSDARRFLLNVAQWFMGGTGNVRVHTTNPRITDPTGLTAVLTGAGYTVHACCGPLVGYHTVVVGGFGGPDLATLEHYVRAGGNVLLLGGTAALPGPVDAPVEAALWNPFLNRFGLAYDVTAPDYNNIVGNVEVINLKNQAPFGPALFQGVTQIYQNNGNNIVAGPAAPPDVISQIFTGARQGSGPSLNGLYAAAQVVPEPATTTLLAGGLAALAAVAVRRRRAR